MKRASYKLAVEIVATTYIKSADLKDHAKIAADSHVQLIAKIFDTDIIKVVMDVIKYSLHKRN